MALHHAGARPRRHDQLRRDHERYQRGRLIKVACERAAYVAGSNNTEIDEDILRQTVEHMYCERGKLSSVGPLE